MQVPGNFREISGKSEGRRAMAGDRQFAFGSFRFDARTGQLWRDGREVKLTPRAAAVLHMLAERAPEVVAKAPDL
jgi:DNA-binding winged helix-turn-helix (wHTH) protein